MEIFNFFFRYIYYEEYFIWGDYDSLGKGLGYGIRLNRVWNLGLLFIKLCDFE